MKIEKGDAQKKQQKGEKKQREKRTSEEMKRGEI